MKVEKIARIAHQVNKAYCESIGDFSQKDWEEAEEWQKDAAIVGVLFVKENPNAGCDATHNEWLNFKKKDGWVYGKKKDEQAKTHPCIVPFDELPQKQQSKDAIFAK